MIGGSRQDQDTLAQIGKRVADKRAQKSWTQPELVGRMNATCYRPDIKQSHISNIERGEGEKLPSVRTLAAMAEVLDTNMDYLAGLSDNDTPARAGPHRVTVNAADDDERALLQEILDLLHRLPREEQHFLFNVIRRLAAAPAVSRLPLVIG